MNMKKTYQDAMNRVMNRVKARPKVWAGGALACVCALGLCWFLARAGGLLPRGASAGQKPEPTLVKHSLQVAQGKTQEWAFEPPRRKTPGRLFGTWSSKAASPVKTIGSDDTLASFQIRGSKNETLHTLERSTGANFDVRVEEPGKYTFWFDNGGLVRRSDRVIEIDATYQPD
jgi:hypothetical protein